MVRSFVALSLCVVLSSVVYAQPVYVDLEALLDTDVVLEAGGSGLTPALDDDGNYLDASTLPASYADGSAYGEPEGERSFLFAPLQRESLDAMRVDGQRIEVPAGVMQSIDLALLAAPGVFGDPVSSILFHYADGSSDEARLGPVSDWTDPASAFENIRYNYVDDSQIETLIEFETLTSDEELYLLQESGTNSNGAGRFIDGTGFALYAIDIPSSITEGTLGLTMGNNFQVSIATEYFDPEFSIEEGFTEIANSMDIHDGFEHRSLGNLQLYEFDISPFLEAQTGELYILLTDATPDNGWGPDVRSIQLFTGELIRFDETLGVTATAESGEIFAQFQTDGNSTEADYLFDNRASGPADRGHRFADAGGSLTYRFDLDDELTDASVVVDMANNFVVSVAGSLGNTRLAQMSPGTENENDFLFENNNSSLAGNHRFTDGSASMTYRFDLPDDETEAVAVITVGNQFVIEIAGDDEQFTLEQDYVAETGSEPRDNSNLADYNFDLTPYLAGNTSNVVYIRLSDGQPADGWGADLYSISIVDQVAEDDVTFTEVLRSDVLFGEDIRNEYNKGYYTIPLGDVMADNPTNEVFIRFTDGSTNDGWGPGIFWMAAYSGSININNDRNLMPGLKTTAGTPETHTAGLNSRRYAVDSGKTLTAIEFSDTADDSGLYLLGVTANPSTTGLRDWVLY